MNVIETVAWPILIGCFLHEPLPFHNGSAPCNNTNYTIVSPPGVQPETVTSTGCAQGTLELHLKISAEGDVFIVEGSVEGAVKASIQSPASCTSSYVWHSAEIHECSGELEEWHCNPKKLKVRVKYFELADPCPDTTDLLALVSEYASEVIGGNPFIIPLKCKQLDNATSTLDPSAKFRWSAGIIKCAPTPQAPAPQPNPEWRQFGTFVYVDVTGAPTKYEIESFIPPNTLVGGVFGFHAWAPWGGTQEVPDMPVGLLAVLDAHGPLQSVNALECDIEELIWSETESGATAPARQVARISGDLWANGDFSLDRHLPVLTESPAGEVEVEQFAEHWSRVEGDIYYAQTGLESGTVYPNKNGAAAFICASEIASGERLSRWVSDPFSLGSSGAAGFVESTDVDDGFSRYRRQRYTNVVTLVVDQSGDLPRIVERTVHDLSGALKQRTSYGEFAEVAVGVWRPMRIQDDRPDALGNLARSDTYSLSGRLAVLSSAAEMELPQPTLDRWTVWVQ